MTPYVHFWDDKCRVLKLFVAQAHAFRKLRYTSLELSRPLANYVIRENKTEEIATDHGEESDEVHISETRTVIRMRIQDTKT